MLRSNPKYAVKCVLLFHCVLINLRYFQMTVAIRHQDLRVCGQRPHRLLHRVRLPHNGGSLFVSSGKLDNKNIIMMF